MKFSLKLNLALFIVTIYLVSCTKQVDLMNIEASQIANATKDANLQTARMTQDGSLADSYIIVYKDDVTNIDDEVNQASKKYGLNIKFKYKNAIKGFSAKLSAGALNGLMNNPNIAYIEQDQIMSANQIVSSPTTQTKVLPWGLDRIDQVSLPLTGGFTYTADGTGVDAYIFDTGILLEHAEFSGRTLRGFSSILNANWSDQNGHGTHVAGTVGGINYGVAKKINLIAVRVLDAAGSGSSSGVIAGIDWAIADHTFTKKPAVGNMSLGGGASTAIDAAVNKAISDGIVMCVAAGNNGRSASNYSPARVTNAITVGATGFSARLSTYDAFASYSNSGSVVDILAPGSGITSAWIGSATAVKTISGTSMATPHVAGVVGLYLSINLLQIPSPAAVQSAIKSAATLNKISGVPRGTVNSLLNTKY